VALTDEQALAAAAERLGAARVAGWSVGERRLAAAAVSGTAVSGGAVSGGAVSGGAVSGGAVSGGSALTDAVSGVLSDADGAVRHDVAAIRAQIRAGEDPLGELFCRIRPPAERRAAGQTFTPKAVIESMIRWAARTVEPARVVDPGVGSARFLVAAGRTWPEAVLLGLETDPLAAMIGRANLAAAGMADRATIMLADYRSADLPPAAGPTLFLGNPPYVRHHQVPAAWKGWLRSTAASLRLPASGLAGLHAHFFLATALHAVPGDAGVLVTAAEWLDVNYGALVRALLLGPLGGEAIHVLDPATAVFADAATTSAITCFRPGARPASIRLRQVASAAALGELAGGAATPVATLRAAPRWREFASHPAARARGLPPGQVELGELCRVHRGQVTGANRVWIARADQTGLPRRFLYHAVTRASELFRAAGSLATTAPLRCVIDLPAELGELPDAERAVVEEFLVRARAAGAADSYIARHRAPWWRVRLGPPAPILATYMARRPPAFVRNLAGARHVNIAHGLYPREPLPGAALDGLAAFLRQSVVQEQGRTYAGGLTKFEPREMERLPVPLPHLLAGNGSAAAAPGPVTGSDREVSAQRRPGS
jgi:adenine-specific DNA-methyltransferase